MKKIALLSWFSGLFPFGYRALSTSFYKTDYHQEVFGAFANSYIYSGRSEHLNINLAYLLYRDTVKKTTFSGSFWARHSQNYIDNSTPGAKSYD